MATKPHPDNAMSPFDMRQMASYAGTHATGEVHLQRQVPLLVWSGKQLRVVELDR